jgi:magnesium-transporting ATPase (P-type)
LFAVVVVSAVTSVVNWLQDREFNALAKQQSDRKVTVWRNGVEDEISIFDLVVGDVLKLAMGEVLPCDCLLIEGYLVKCSEANLTGESAQLSKGPKDPFMLGGSQMDEGSGIALVITTGENTSYGQIVRELVNQESPETPLQIKLDDLAKLIGYVGMGFGIATFAVLLIAWGASNPQNVDAAVIVNRVLGAFVVAITITVVAVPEGLPLAVTISLAFSMRSMIKDMTLVRELQSCETMGSATAICSDKTGTLTENRMTAVAATIGAHTHRVDGKSAAAAAAAAAAFDPSSPSTTARATLPSPEILAAGDKAEGKGVSKEDIIGAQATVAALSVAISLNSAAQVHYLRVGEPDHEGSEPPMKDGHDEFEGAPDDLTRPRFHENKTECALLHGLRTSYNVKYADLRNAAGKLALRIDFNSARKRMTSLLSYDAWVKSLRAVSPETSVHEGARRLAEIGVSFDDDSAAASSAGSHSYVAVALVKGAAEIMLELCTKMRTSRGTVVPMTDELREANILAMEKLTSTGLRTLAICERLLTAEDLPCELDAEGAEDKLEAAKDSIEQKLTLVGLIGIKDPVRAAVPEAMRKCDVAGIRVRMCTGDNIRTARFIARECGILPDLDDHPERARLLDVGSRPVMQVVAELEARGEKLGEDFDEDKAREMAAEAMKIAGAEEDESEADEPVTTPSGHIAETKSAQDRARRAKTNWDAGADVLPEGERPVTTLEDARGLISMEGREFRALNREERIKVVPHLAVLARSSPTDKLLLVNTLKYMGEIVSVTGDGSNDAPALKASHVGLAMGITGTEVAKEASKVIILDDNFASIVKAVRWGRSVVENIRRFLVLQLTINVVALTVTFIVAAANQGDVSKFPISVSQLLWVNLLMDSAAALALATEPPTDHLLHQKPQGRAALMTRIMMKMISVNAVWQIFFILLLTYVKELSVPLFVLDDHDFGEREHLTCIFNTFVWLQLWAKLHARKIHDELNIMEGFFESHIALIVIFLIIVGQIIIVEFGGEFMVTTHLRAEQWLICIALGFTSIPVGYISRIIPIWDKDDNLAVTLGIHKREEPEGKAVARANPHGHGIELTEPRPAVSN